MNRSANGFARSCYWRWPATGTTAILTNRGYAAMLSMESSRAAAMITPGLYSRSSGEFAWCAATAARSAAVTLSGVVRSNSTIGLASASSVRIESTLGRAWNAFANRGVRTRSIFTATITIGDSAPASVAAAMSVASGTCAYASNSVRKPSCGAVVAHPTVSTTALMTATIRVTSIIIPIGTNGGWSTFYLYGLPVRISNGKLFDTWQFCRRKELRQIRCRCELPKLKDWDVAMIP